MKNTLLERVPVSSYISRADCDPKIYQRVARLILKTQQLPASLAGCQEVVESAMRTDRDFMRRKHYYYEEMKSDDIREIVRRIAGLIDLMIPAAKGDSVFAAPLLDLVDQMQEFLAEMNAELGPVPCGDGNQIGSLFNDMVSMETDLVKLYNTLPKLYEEYLEQNRNNNNQK